MTTFRKNIPAAPVGQDHLPQQEPLRLIWTKPAPVYVPSPMPVGSAVVAVVVSIAAGTAAYGLAIAAFGLAFAAVAFGLCLAGCAVAFGQV